ncbi:MAG: homoserine dehydrogenase ThrA [Nitrospirae bacterium]|nr:homoserine dehydrogenase ThrA [Nitrospirota bacterium]MBS1234363.1 homoserine dehydrogenase ThrA [Nitrospirota bacterium]
MINIGIIGFGTVGTGTASILIKNRKLLKDRTGFDIHLKKIADLDIKRDRGIRLPKGVLTNNADSLIADPDIHIIVELIGGTTVAKEIMLKAIRNGKHVVTANKALLATHGTEIFKAAERNGVRVGFEASVAGGIPIIKIISEGLVANRIKSIYGIINGTTNYILSKMSDEKAEFSDVLKEAQNLGYAEADPTYDIEGIDSAHKLAILASLAYGSQFSLKDVYREGISGISSMDIEFARELGYKLKLLAITKETNGKIELRVHPTMIPEEFLLSKVDGVFNAVYVEGDAVGSTLYYGRGAGDMPTGSAVVSDIVDISCDIVHKTIGRNPLFSRGDKGKNLLKMDDVISMYFFRFSAIDKPGVLSRISGILGKYNISIASVIQKDRRAGKAVPLVVLTHRAREKDVLSAVKEINKLPIVADKTVFIRVEGRE